MSISVSHHLPRLFLLQNEIPILGDVIYQRRVAKILGRTVLVSSYCVRPNKKTPVVLFEKGFQRWLYYCSSSVPAIAIETDLLPREKFPLFVIQLVVANFNGVLTTYST